MYSLSGSLYLEAKRKAEQKKLAEAEQQRKAEEKKRKEAEAKRLAEEKKRKEEEARKRAEAKKRAEAEAKRKAELEALRKEKEAQQAREAEMRAAMEAEANAREIDRYIALIKQKVNRNWVRPAGIGEGLKCRLRVRLATGGNVIVASVIESSGNGAFDRSATAAVHKADPLPAPTGSLFNEFRDINFVFEPTN